MTVNELYKIMQNLEDETQIFITFDGEALSAADIVVDAYVVSGSKEEINGLYIKRY